MIESGSLTSIILHGPPGTGKTTLARVIANTTNRVFMAENAASVGVKRIREIIDEAVHRIESSGSQTILFLDEIHRFTRAQQDVLLEDVERARITLVGATTENPLFSVNSALVSRSTLFRLEPLDAHDIKDVLLAAIRDPDRGFGSLMVDATEEAIEHWAVMCEGDARRALNALELAVRSAPMHESGRGRLTIDLAAAQDSIQRKAILYDRAGDQHYDHASAFIKAIRGSDPDAGVYWLALMLEAGEDPRFIARRLAILASEDIGNADPQAIVVASATWSLVERIGMPEARITLAQCVTYLALAPKSNASYLAIDAASEDVRSGATVPVPISLRDKHKSPSHGSPEHGQGYRYSHSDGVPTSIGGVTGEDYLGVEKHYYQPGSVGQEAELARRLEEVRARRATLRRGTTPAREQEGEL